MFNFKVDKRSPIPYYFQIEEWIRALIERGKLKPGDAIPTEAELVEQLGVSRLTVRQALNNLTHEGLLIRKRAKGTFVAPPRSQVPFVRDRLTSLTEEVERDGFSLKSKVLRQDLIPASGEIKQQLAITGAQQVILIHRVRSVNEIPIALETTCHPYRRFAELLDMDLNDSSIYQILDRQYHARPDEAVDCFFASVATQEEADLLELDPGDPVMRYTRTAYDHEGEPVEFTKSTYRADRFEFVIRYKKPFSGQTSTNLTVNPLENRPK